MLDLSIVRHKYASMTDEQLQVFAKFESRQIGADAFQLLKEEFEKRNLDPYLLESSETDEQLEQLQKHSLLEKTAMIAFTETIWQYALDEKAKGSTNYEIFNGLIAQKIEEESAYLIIQGLGNRASKLADEANTQIIAGAVGFGGGLLLLYLVFNGTLTGLYLLIGASASVFGAIRFARGQKEKEKYESIVERCKDSSK